MLAKYNRHDFKIIQGAIDFLDTAHTDVTLSGVAHRLEISPDKLTVTLKKLDGHSAGRFPAISQPRIFAFDPTYDRCIRFGFCWSKHSCD